MIETKLVALIQSKSATGQVIAGNRTEHGDLDDLLNNGWHVIAAELDQKTGAWKAILQRTTPEVLPPTQDTTLATFLKDLSVDSLYSCCIDAVEGGDAATVDLIEDIIENADADKQERWQQLYDGGFERDLHADLYMHLTTDTLQAILRDLAAEERFLMGRRRAREIALMNPNVQEEDMIDVVEGLLDAHEAAIKRLPTDMQRKLIGK